MLTSHIDNSPPTGGRNVGRTMRRLGPWVVCAAVVLFNILAVGHENEYRHTLRQKFRAATITEQEHHVAQGSMNVSTYLTDVLMEMQLIGQLLARSGLAAMPRDTIETIARHNVTRNWITELYVVERDFTGKKAPMAAFEFDDDKVASGVEEEYDLENEKEEYAEILQQMRVYADRPEVNCRLSGVMNLCALKKGQVFTVPIRADGKLLGLIAAMLPAKHMMKLLNSGAPDEQSQQWLIGAGGRPIVAPAQQLPRIDIPLSPKADGQPQPVTMRKDGLVISICTVQSLDIGPLAVAAAISDEKMNRMAAAEIGGPRSASLLGVLVIGNLVGAYLLLLFRHWRRRSDHFRREAERDNLTGLYSRHKLDDVLRNPDHDSDEVAVLMIDLNGFKATNDKFGHECGDQLLQAVANLLRGCLRQCDMAFRFGGDEFLILLHHADQSTASRVTTRIEKRAARWNLANRVPGAILSLAIGEATGLAADMDALIRQADSRMYLHKTISSGQCAQAVESDGPSLDDQRTAVSVARTFLPDDELR